MKGKNLTLIGVIVFIVGLLLVMFRTTLADGGIVRLAGIIFVGAGLLNMTLFLTSRDKDGRAKTGAVGTALGWIASAAAVVLGLSMLIFKGAFVALIGFMFGVLLLFAAVFQMCLLIFGSRPVRIPNWFFLVPAVIVGAAIYIFLRKPDTTGETTDLLITGISLMVFGVASVVEGSIIGQSNRKMLRASADGDRKEEKAIAETSASETEKHD